MMHHDVMLLAAAAGAVGAYALFLRGLLEVGKPVRSLMFNRADAALADPHLSAKERERIELFAKCSMSPWITWLLAALIVPTTCWIVVKALTGHELRTSALPAVTQRKVAQFDALWMVSVMTTSPVGSILLLLLGLPSLAVAGMAGIYYAMVDQTLAHAFERLAYPWHALHHHS